MGTPHQQIAREMDEKASTRRGEKITKKLVGFAPSTANHTASTTRPTNSRKSRTQSMKLLASKIEEMERMNFELEEFGSTHCNETDNKNAAMEAEKLQSTKKKAPLFKKMFRKGADRMKGIGFTMTQKSEKMCTKNLNDEEERALQEKLHLANLEYEEDRERHRHKRESKNATLILIREHLEEFVQEFPTGSYEDWVKELHPENARSERNIFEGNRIDHRFFVEGSDHRKIWNENLGGDGARKFVPAANDTNENN